MRKRIHAERATTRGFVSFDLRDGPLDESRVQVAGPAVVGIQNGDTILRDADGVALMLVDGAGLRLLVYRPPMLPATVLTALRGRPLRDLLDPALIAAADLRPDAAVEEVELHRTPWDGPHARLAERVLPTLEVNLRPD